MEESTIMISAGRLHIFLFLLLALQHGDAWIGNSLASNGPKTSSPHGQRTIFYMTTFDDEMRDQSQSSDGRNSSDEFQFLSSEGSPLQKSNQQHQQPYENVTAAVMKKIRVSMAQAEIDRILASPDAPMDLDSELERVISISASLSRAEQKLVVKDEQGQKDEKEGKDHVNEEQQEKTMDRMISELEVDLYEAVKNQDFGLAAKRQQEIGELQVDDCGAVLQVNSAFYRAFSNKNIDEMADLWLEGSTSICIHPSHKPLVGSKSVLKSWKKMFETKDGSFQRNWMEPHQIQLSMKGSNTAIITCEEHVFARRFVRGKRRKTELINKLMATNIFRKVGSKWYLCYHHASWHADSEAAKLALGGEGRSTSKSKKSSRKLSVVNRNSMDDDMDDDMDIEAAMDGILGSNFGPVLGPSGQGEDKKVKRVIVGSLPDLLGGGLGDLLGLGPGGGDEGQGNIIKFSRIDGSDDSDDDDDDDDDDASEEIIIQHIDDGDDDDDDDLDDVSIIKQWSKSSLGSNNQGSSSSSIISISNSNKDPALFEGGDRKESGAPKDALRQNCISALRKLCDQGSISPKQKRVLLTDIIACSAKGDYSMVEVAFELLCGEGEDKDAAEEEFADQCRVFASSLPESLPPRSRM